MGKRRFRVGKRSAAPSKTPGKRRASRDLDLEDEDGLHIGNIHILTSQGYVQGMQPAGRNGQHRRQSLASECPGSSRAKLQELKQESEASDEDMLGDYMQKLAAHNSGDDTDDQEVMALRRAMKRFGRAKLAEDCSAELQDAMCEASSSSDADSEHSTSSGYESDASIGEIIDEFEAGLSLQQKFPVQARDVPPSPRGSGARGRRSKGAVRGANHGQLLPGEKRKLKRAAVDGKRAARAAAHGLDLHRVNEELELFVAHRGDMKGFPPANKYAQQITMKLASLYGLKSSVQGSGKQRFVVIASCERTALPSGKAQEQVAALLADQMRAEAAFGRGKVQHTRQPQQARRRSSWDPSTPKAGRRAEALPRFNQPLGFVSSGLMEMDIMEVKAPLQSIAEQQAAAACEDRGTEEACCEAGIVIAERLCVSVDLGDGVTVGIDQSRLAPDAHPAELLDAEALEAEQSPSFERLQFCDAIGSAERLADLEDAEPQSAGLGFAGLGFAGGSSIGPSSDGSMPGIQRGGPQREQQRPPEKPPAMFMTKQQLKRAKKKEEKDARRSVRGAQGPALEDGHVATGLAYGSFEQHTTGYGSRMMANTEEGKAVLLSLQQAFTTGRLRELDSLRLQKLLLALHTNVPSAPPLRSLSSLKRQADAEAGEHGHAPAKRQRTAGANGSELQHGPRQSYGRQESPAVSGYSAGDNWKDKCLDILRAVLGVIPADQRFIFDRPVDQRLVPDYYTIIKRPMDLGTITHNLQTGKYDGPLQFCEDMRLVWKNCFTYNAKDSPVGKLGKLGEREWEQRWAASGLSSSEARARRNNAGIAAAKYEPALGPPSKRASGAALSGGRRRSDDGAPSYSGQREPRSNNRPMNRARMEEMAAILSNQDLAENDLMGAIKIIKADSDDTAEEDDNAEFELDFEKLSNPTLWKLSNYCKRIENKLGAASYVGADDDSEFEAGSDDPDDPDA